MCAYNQLAEQADLRVLNLFHLKVFLSVVNWQIFVLIQTLFGGVDVDHDVIFSFDSAQSVFTCHI